MKNLLTIKVLFIASLMFTASMGVAREYIIYSIMQDISMGDEGDEGIKKNYYINLGQKQGLREGTSLDVFRHISILDPYQSKNRYNYKVKVGELEVIHVESSSAIAITKSLRSGAKVPYFELSGFMIGDKVDVMVK